MRVLIDAIWGTRNETILAADLAIDVSSEDIDLSGNVRRTAS